MHNYRSILLASLLMTGIAMSTSLEGFHSQALHQSGFDQQFTTVASESSRQKDCPDDGQSPPPGCGRRDKDITKDDGLRG